MSMKHMTAALFVLGIVCGLSGCACILCNVPVAEARYVPAQDPGPQALISAGSESLAAAVEKLAAKYPAYGLKCSQTRQSGNILYCYGDPVGTDGQIWVYFDKDGSAIRF